MTQRQLSLFDLPETPPAQTPPASAVTVAKAPPNTIKQIQQADRKTAAPSQQSKKLKLETLKPRAASIFKYSGQTYATADLGQTPEQYTECLQLALHNLPVLYEYLKAKKLNSISKSYDQEIHENAVENVLQQCQQPWHKHFFKYGNNGWEAVRLNIEIGTTCPHCNQHGCLETQQHINVTTSIQKDGTLHLRADNKQLKVKAGYTCTLCGKTGKSLPFTLKSVPYLHDHQC